LSEKKRGLASKAHLHSAAAGKSGTLFVPGHLHLSKSFSFGRVLGRVWIDGSEESLSELQERTGHATKQKPLRLNR
jgi:hypothetical protein